MYINYGCFEITFLTIFLWKSFIVQGVMANIIMDAHFLHHHQQKKKNTFWDL